MYMKYFWTSLGMYDQEDVRKNARLFPFSPGLGGLMNSKTIKVKRMGVRRGNNTQLYLAKFRSPWKQWTETLKTLASGFCFLL